jgi:hypothetical protein
MALIGFNFTKINVEKKKAVKGGIKITNNIHFVDIKEAKVNFIDKKTALNVEFVFTCKFEPEVGIIELKGNAIELLEDDKTKEALDKWKKDKKLPTLIAQKILNSLLNKCYVESLILSNSMNLPSPVPLPKIKSSAKSTKQKK